jgi:prepilin-type N-terminal cleavage/methylation domain-containing protein
VSGGSQRPRDGFTLIELLIVIVILGVLATVVVFSVRGVRAEAEESACAADEQSLVTAVEGYLALKPAATVGDPSLSSAQREQLLVGFGLLRDISDYWDINANGGLVVVGTPCTTL